MSIEAMKQALEALDWRFSNADAAIQALRQAIEQAEKWDTSDMAHRSGGLSVEQAEKQKPVPVGMTCKVWTHGCALFDGIDLPNETLFYTAPPSKPWVSLTDDEIAQVVGSPIDEVYLSDFRNVEAKLKERNNG
jgi:hypothetical protein